MRRLINYLIIIIIIKMIFRPIEDICSGYLRRLLDVRNIYDRDIYLLGGPMTLPHFTNVDLMTRYGDHQTLHFTYYLRHARPSFAVFAFTLANYKFDSHKINRRLAASFLTLFLSAQSMYMDLGRLSFH